MKKLTSEQLLTVFKAVDDEPEFPDEMPNCMWEGLENCSREELTNAFKLCIKLTKVSIGSRLDQRLLNVLDPSVKNKGVFRMFKEII